MKPFLEPQRLAGLVSAVTETMLGMTFLPDVVGSPWSSLVWRTAVLPIAGDRPFTVGISSDERGCTALTAAMFGCPPIAVDAAMMNDALCELVNITAGVLKKELELSVDPALPSIVHGSDAPYMAPAQGRSSVVLRGREVGLVLWVVEGVEGAPPARPAM
jgi:Chemotaxis phosphatase CheX